MDTSLNCKQNHMPHYLDNNEIVSPLIVIKNHFAVAHLYEWRQTLWFLLNAVMTDGLTCNKLHKPKRSASETIYDSRLIEKLIEACSVLVSTDLNQSLRLKNKSKKKHRIKILTGRKKPNLVESKEILYCIQFLDDEEISNPHLALSSFFHYYSLDEWRYILSEWLSYGLSNSSNIGESWYKDTFYCYVQLIRLTEACFLINELENKD